MSWMWEAMLEEATIIDRSTVPDGRGGSKTAYTEGASIDAAFSYLDSDAMRIAEKDKTLSRYTITTRQNVDLQVNDIIRRESDQQLFLITSKGQDNKTPAISAMNMRQVSAREWELPNG